MLGWLAGGLMVAWRAGCLAGWRPGGLVSLGFREDFLGILTVSLGFPMDS